MYVIAIAIEETTLETTLGGNKMDFNINKEGRVYEIAEAVRRLNNLSEEKLHVLFGSWYEIVYGGNIEELTLPEGYYVSTYNERGNVRPCIMNKGNTGDNTYWLFVFRQN